MLEKRWVMFDRKRIRITLGIAFSLTLLALVSIASVRALRSVPDLPRPDSPHSAFALVSGLPTPYLSAELATHAVQTLKALPCEDDEEEKSEAPVELRVSFRGPGSFREVSERESIAPPSILSRYPLRF